MKMYSLIIKSVFFFKESLTDYIQTLLKLICAVKPEQFYATKVT